MSKLRSTYQPSNWMGYRSTKTRPTPYEILMRQSRLLGRTAAQALSATRTALVDSSSAIARRVSPRVNEQQFFEDNPDPMHKVVAQSQEILAGARTVILPYNIFPDTITVDRMKVTINLWNSLWAREVVTLRIEDILNVSAHLGLLFGSLTVSTRIMNSTDHFKISGFWNRDAVRLKHIIQGYMIARHEGIDVSELSTERLVRKLNELGNDPSVVK